MSIQEIFGELNVHLLLFFFLHTLSTFGLEDFLLPESTQGTESVKIIWFY